MLIGDSIQYKPSGSVHAVLWGTRDSAGTVIGGPPPADGDFSQADEPIQTGADKDHTDGGVNSQDGDFRYRHSGAAANALFADGHAETLSKGRILNRHMYTNY